MSVKKLSRQKSEFYLKGQQEAREDINVNKLKLKTLGRKTSWFQEWQEILLREFQIEVVTIASCLVSDEESDYSRGYNKIAEKEIENRFGYDFFEKTLDRAESIWNLKPDTPIEKTDNGNEEVSAVLNKYGWVKCSNCNKSFKIKSEVSWNGKFHLSCGQKIKIIKVKN